MTAFTNRLQQHFYNSFKSEVSLHCSEVLTQGLQEPSLVSSNALLAKQLGIDPG